MRRWLHGRLTPANGLSKWPDKDEVREWGGRRSAAAEQAYTAERGFGPPGEISLIPCIRKASIYRSAIYTIGLEAFDLISGHLLRYPTRFCTEATRTWTNC